VYRLRGMASAPSLDSRASLFAKCVKVARENGRGRPGLTPDGLSRLPALGLLRFRRDNLMLIRSGPTRDVFWTTRVGPNQTAGPTAWPNRFYANFVAKNSPVDIDAQAGIFSGVATKRYVGTATACRSGVFARAETMTRNLRWPRRCVLAQFNSTCRKPRHCQRERHTKDCPPL
jgi:hypothetical protein